jgi:hypothetical protein
MAIGLTAALTMAALSAAIAAGQDVVIGDIDDLSGVYSDVSGPGAADAMRMAIADFGGTVLGRKIFAQDLVLSHRRLRIRHPVTERRLHRRELAGLFGRDHAVLGPGT